MTRPTISRLITRPFAWIPVLLLATGFSGVLPASAQQDVERHFRNGGGWMRVVHENASDTYFINKDEISQAQEKGLLFGPNQNVVQLANRLQLGLQFLVVL